MERTTIQSNNKDQKNHYSNQQSDNPNKTAECKTTTTSPPVPATTSWSSLFASRPNATSITKTQAMPFVPAESAIDQNLPPTASSTEIIADPKNGRSSEHQSQRHSPASLKLANFLAEYNNDWATISLRPRGLINRSNYCYINSTLQALLGCSPLYNLIRSMPQQAAHLCEVRTPAITALVTFMSKFSDLPSGVSLGNNDALKSDWAFEPTEIYKLWTASGRERARGQQEDAEEFLSFVLNKMNDEMLEVSGNNDRTGFGSTPLSEIFRGELRSRLQREGEDPSDVTQPFFTLQLNIEKTASVKEALDILFSRQKLHGVTGTKTGQPVAAWQQQNLEKLPPILILHLKCFAYRSYGCTKILKKFDFPLKLKIDPKIVAANKYSLKQKSYRLIAVVYHHGLEATRGHYTADVYHSGYGSWLRYNDRSVTPVSASLVLSPPTPRVPYLLYYQRCDTIIKQSSSSSTGHGNFSGTAASSSAKVEPKLQQNANTHTNICTSPIIIRA